MQVAVRIAGLFARLVGAYVGFRCRQRRCARWFRRRLVAGGIPQAAAAQLAADYGAPVRLTDLARRFRARSTRHARRFVGTASNEYHRG